MSIQTCFLGEDSVEWSANQYLREDLKMQMASFSTDHFWYRPQPEGPYIDSQRNNKAFGFADGTIFLSEDNGDTWPYNIAFPNAAT